MPGVSELRCPDDGHVLLAEKERVAFWSCRHCHGLWFPRESLEKRQHVRIPAKSRVTSDTREAGKRNCPQCGVAMRQERDKDTTIDVCDRCSGVWLDPGEYPAALRRAARERFKRERPSLAGGSGSLLDRAIESLLDVLEELQDTPEVETRKLFQFLDRKRAR